MTKHTFLVSIPTYNSAKTIEKAITSVQDQKDADYSLNIVDSYSSDETQKIARSLNAPCILYKGKLLGARYEGFINSDAEYVIFMDSDQVLSDTMLKRLNALLQEDDYDMVILGETSYKTETYTEKMFCLDRKNVHKEFEYNLSPENGVLLPRVFKKSLLIKAFNEIDESLYPEVVSHDHAIIYFEATKFSKHIGYLKNAVFHQEPTTLTEVFTHFKRFGHNTREFMSLGLYNDLIVSKMSGRNKGFMKNMTMDKVKTFPLLFAKWLGYYYGYYLKR
jgi:glycosyltransferase involved in cell wall biosynthesis